MDFVRRRDTEPPPQVPPLRHLPSFSDLHRLWPGLRMADDFGRDDG